MLTFEGEFDSLPGDPTKEFTAYGPESSELTLNPAKAPEKEAEDDDDEVDLFGSDDEEEDAEAARIKEERLAEYNKKKAGKVKPAAKSIVTMDVKPWGMCLPYLPMGLYANVVQMTRQTWTSSRRTFFPSRRRVSSGVLPSLLLSVSVSRSSRSTWSSRTTRSRSTSSSSRSKSSRTTSSPPTSLPCRSCRCFLLARPFYDLLMKTMHDHDGRFHVFMSSC